MRARGCTVLVLIILYYGTKIGPVLKCSEALVHVGGRRADEAQQSPPGAGPSRASNYSKDLFAANRTDGLRAPAFMEPAAVILGQSGSAKHGEGLRSA